MALYVLYLGRESASIWLSKLERPGQMRRGKSPWDVLATNGTEYEVKLNADTGR